MNELNYCKDCRWMHARWERKGFWFAKVYRCASPEFTFEFDAVTKKTAVAPLCDCQRAIKRLPDGCIFMIGRVYCPAFEAKQFARPRQDMKPAPALPHRSFAPPRPIPTPEPPPRTHSFIPPKPTPMHEPPPRQTEKED